MNMVSKACGNNTVKTVTLHIIGFRIKKGIHCSQSFFSVPLAFQYPQKRIFCLKCVCVFYVFLFILKFYTQCNLLCGNIIGLKKSLIRKIVRKIFLKIGRNLTNIGQNAWYPVVARTVSLLGQS